MAENTEPSDVRNLGPSPSPYHFHVPICGKDTAVYSQGLLNVWKMQRERGDPAFELAGTPSLCLECQSWSLARNSVNMSSLLPHLNTCLPVTPGRVRTKGLGLPCGVRVTATHQHRRNLEPSPGLWGHTPPHTLSPLLLSVFSVGVGTKALNKP